MATQPDLFDPLPATAEVDASTAMLAQPNTLLVIEATGRISQALEAAIAQHPKYAAERVTSYQEAIDKLQSGKKFLGVIAGETPDRKAMAAKFVATNSQGKPPIAVQFLLQGESHFDGLLQSAKLEGDYGDHVLTGSRRALFPKAYENNYRVDKDALQCLLESKFPHVQNGHSFLDDRRLP